MDKIFEKANEHPVKPEVSPTTEDKIEKIPSPENIGEKLTEQNSENENKNLAREQVGEAAKSRPIVKTAAQQRAEAIDRILSDGLGDIFVSLPPQKQKEFKDEGEKTVQKINELIEKGKLTLSGLVKLICKWLSVIPGVNRFFLEQDAKIKADKIMEINNER